MSSLIKQDELKYNLHSIQDVIERKLDSNNPHEIANQLIELQSILSLSVIVQASCKFFLENKRNECFKNCINEIAVLKVQLSKQLIDSYCSVELSAYELAERQNRCIVHQIDALRSVLSFAKSELENLKHQ